MGPVRASEEVFHDVDGFPGSVCGAAFYGGIVQGGAGPGEEIRPADLADRHCASRRSSRKAEDAGWRWWRRSLSVAGAQGQQEHNAPPCTPPSYAAPPHTPPANKKRQGGGGGGACSRCGRNKARLP